MVLFGVTMQILLTWPFTAVASRKEDRATILTTEGKNFMVLKVVTKSRKKETQESGRLNDLFFLW